MGVNSSVYFIHFRQQFTHPDVHYSEQFEGSDLEAAMERGYRRLKFFVRQLLVLTLTYVLAAYDYKW